MRIWIKAGLKFGRFSLSFEADALFLRLALCNPWGSKGVTQFFSRSYHPRKTWYSCLDVSWLGQLASWVLKLPIWTQRSNWLQFISVFGSLWFFSNHSWKLKLLTLVVANLECFWSVWIQKKNLRIHAQVEDVVYGRGRLWPCPPQRRQFRGSQRAEVANAPVPCFYEDVEKWRSLKFEQNQLKTVFWCYHGTWYISDIDTDLCQFWTEINLQCTI